MRSHKIEESPPPILPTSRELIERLTAFPEAKTILKKKIRSNKKNITQLKKEKFLIEESINKRYTSRAKAESAGIVNFRLYEIDQDIEFFQKENKLIDRAIKVSSTDEYTEVIVGGVTDKEIVRACEYPIPELIELNRAGFATSIWNPGEKTPSMKYYKDSNRVYCFSTNQGGSPIDVVMVSNGLSFIEAVKFLNK